MKIGESSSMIPGKLHLVTGKKPVSLNVCVTLSEHQHHALQFKWKLRPEYLKQKIQNPPTYMYILDYFMCLVVKVT
jgi:hypothetical protein